MSTSMSSYQDPDENGGDNYEEPAPRHTQFLDLTNGEGGSRGGGYYNDSMAPATPPAAAPSLLPTVSIASTSRSAPNPIAALGGGSVRIDPSTPGKVVEAGQEHTGRWTKEEHEAFLSALAMYGKEWKKVAAKVKTRTVVQTRTHAQKYFQKLQKASEKGDIAHVEMGVASAAKKASAQRKKPKAELGSRSQSTTAAAHLVTNLSSMGSQANTSGTTSSQFGSIPAPHGFSSNSYYSQNTSNDWSNSSKTGLKMGPPGSMKIVAPDPGMSMERGFPEPSPAACGKRKLAEIAAAQMLAGVAASNHNNSNNSAYSNGTVDEANAATPPPPDAEPVRPTPRKGLSLQIVNPESLGITYSSAKKSRGGDSPVTPWDGELEALLVEEKRKEDESNSSDGVGVPSIPFPSMLDEVERSYHAVVGPASSYNRSPLHRAICEVDIPTIQMELADGIGVASLHRKDEAGFYPIHSACALSLIDHISSPQAYEIVNLLMSAGAEVSTLDSKHNTPLHWAARAGDEEVARMLLSNNCPPDAQNEEGDTALHWAMRAGRIGMRAVHVLIQNSARPQSLNHKFKRPLDVAADGFVDSNSEGKKGKKKTESKRRKQEVTEERREVRANLLSVSAQSRSLVLYHPECQEHIPKSESDWEAPDRISSILRRIVRSDGSTESTGIFPHEVSVTSEFDKATLELLSRVHSTEYLSFVNNLSKELSRRNKDDGDGDGGSGPSKSVVPFTPMVQKTIMKDAEVKKEAHSDTAFSAGSLRAARRAAGAVQYAVDCVLIGRNRNAFCVVRPPGHHAGVKGLLAGGESCGFCIFNNVAAGAMHAISDERLTCQRCAIVDIDVHHGNGTEEIIKNSPDPSKLFFFSIHLYDHDRRKNGYSFYPGTGDEDDVAHNIINVPITPLWREPTSHSPIPNVVASAHNTRHKAKRAAATSSDPPADDCLEPIVGSEKVSDTESETASTKSFMTRRPVPASPKVMNMGRQAYRRAIQNRLIPALRAFNPDLILISAGFDAAKGDVGNARHYAGGKEKMGLDLEPDDYAWTTRKILEVADICCQGRVVSVLEGGYGRSSLDPPDGKGDKIPPLDKALFSECAIRHLHAMIDPYDTEARFS